MLYPCEFWLQRATTPDDPMAGYQDPVYDPSLLERIPNEFKDYSLEKLVHNRIELEHFRQFLSENYASMDLMCWMDIEAFRYNSVQTRKPNNIFKRCWFLCIICWRLSASGIIQLFKMNKFILIKIIPNMHSNI